MACISDQENTCGERKKGAGVPTYFRVDGDRTPFVLVFPLWSRAGEV